MNFYPHHISDFNNATRHLTRVERSVYRDLIELYYDTESALTDDIEKLARRVLCNSEEEKKALNDVLSEFFIKKDNGFFHDRCDAEILKYRANTSAKAKAGIASALARQQKATRVEQPLNSVELTNNHEPLTNNLITIVGNGVANCPHQEIISLYAKHLPMLSQVKVWSDARAKTLKARWCENPKRQNLEWWEKFFKYVANSDFLTGRDGVWQNCDLAWLIKSENFIKVIEGKYENKEVSHG